MSVELVNPDIDRVDAVNGPATGIPFLMFKSANTPKEAASVAETETPVEKAAETTADEALESPAEEAAESPAEEAAEDEGEDETVAKSKEPVAPVELIEAIVEETPVAKAEEPAAEVAKAGTVALPSGLLDLLGEVVAAYQQLVNTDSVAPESPADAAAPVVDAMDEEPVEDALAPEADLIKPKAPAVPAPTEESPAEEAAETPAEEAEEPAAEAPKKGKNPFAKSMDDLILEAVTKATAPLLQANAELAKRLEKVESTPVDSGPMLAGQTPGNGGQPNLRGQDAGGVAKGLEKSATPQSPSGMELLAAGLKTTWSGQ